MIKILFVCLGNICRSPMAEYVFKDIVKKRGIEEKFQIDSAATSTEEIGNGMHRGTIEKLNEKGISYGNHKARQITYEDYEEFDYIIGMENANIRNILKIVGEDKENKVHRLLDFTAKPKDIADPWYTGDFDITYDEIILGCEAFLKYCTEKHTIYNKNILEKCLPSYLERDLQNLKDGIKNNVSYIDCLINEVQGSINSAWTDGDITEEQCDYLYKKYVWMENEE